LDLPFVQRTADRRLIRTPPNSRLVGQGPANLFADENVPQRGLSPRQTTISRIFGRQRHQSGA
jgi:hypothetical protein